MFKIDSEKTIHCTRGDVGAISISAKEGTSSYTFEVGEVVRLKVMEKKDCNCIVLQKDVEVEEQGTSVNMVLDSTDTEIGELINKPVDYWYEIELNPETAPQTIIGYDTNGAKIFRLYPEGSEADV